MVSEPDGRLFAWVKITSPWIEPKLYPQIIRDPRMFDWINLQPHNKHIQVVAKRVLTLDEYNLNIKQLIAKYPEPDHERSK